MRRFGVVHRRGITETRLFLARRIDGRILRFAYFTGGQSKGDVILMQRDGKADQREADKRNDDDLFSGGILHGRCRKCNHDDSAAFVTSQRRRWQVGITQS